MSAMEKSVLVDGLVARKTPTVSGTGDLSVTLPTDFVGPTLVRPDYENGQPWWGKRDSNPHCINHMLLRHARLPIRHYLNGTFGRLLVDVRHLPGVERFQDGGGALGSQGHADVSVKMLG